MSEGQPNPFLKEFSVVAEAKIEADRIKNTKEIAVDLVEKNVDFFGGKEKSSEMATEILNRFGRGYKEFSDVVAASVDLNRGKRGRADFDSVVDSVYIAMNMSALGDNLVTELMTAEQIDEVLPEQMKGIGKAIIEKRLMDNVKDDLRGINERINNDRLFTTANNLIKGEYYNKWGETVAGMSEGSIVKQYVEVARSVFEDLGMEEKKVVEEPVRERKRKVEREEKREEEDYFGDEEEGLDGEDALIKKLDELAKMGVAPPIMPYGAEEGGEPGRPEPYFVVSKKNCLKAFKYGLQVDWRDSTPAQWYEKFTLEEKRRFDVAKRVADAAAWLCHYQNLDLAKCRQNPIMSGVSQQEWSSIFTKDFKWGAREFLRDLCKPFVNDDGVRMMRYKLDPETGKIINSVSQKLDFMYDYIDGLSMKIALHRNNPDLSITDDLLEKEKGKESRRDAFARLRVEHPDLKEKEIKEMMRSLDLRVRVTFDDKLDANTIRNYFFAMGDTGFWDTTRERSPDRHVISDKLRTLNPEAKSRKKLRIGTEFKSYKPDEIKEAEWFGGNVGAWVESIFRVEAELGKALDGKRTLQEKLRSGDFKLFSSIMCVGFSDFYYKIYKADSSGNVIENVSENGKKEYISLGKSVSQALFDGDDFSFGKKQADTLTQFRDMYDSAIDCFETLTGKKPVKKGEAIQWASDLNNSVGLMNQIKMEFYDKEDVLHEERIFNFMNRPEFWSICLLNSHGVDFNRLNTDCIYMRNPYGSVDTYKILVDARVHALKQDFNHELNTTKIKEYLGVEEGFGRTAVASWLDSRKYRNVSNTIKDISEKRNLELKKELEKMKRDSVENMKLAGNVAEISKMRKQMWRAMEDGNMIVVERFKREIAEAQLELSGEPQ